MRFVRGLGGLGVAALAGWLVLALLRPPAASAQPVVWTSSVQCRECHEEVYREWESSWHARSWTDPDVRAPSQSNNFANTDCIDCHAPSPVFWTGVGKRVLPRSSRRAEGVDCLSCHLLPDGRIAGTIDDPRAACRPVATLDLQREEFCGVCHNQHKTVDQWRETPYAERGEGCTTCHMPQRDGDPNRGRDHTMAGGHDLELVRSALEFRTWRRAGKIVVEVENVGAGHAYPTDERSRASDLWWRPVGQERWRHLHRIRDPYRWEVDVPSTLLHQGKIRRVEIDDADASEAVEVMLVYKLTPYYRNPADGEPMHLREVVDPLTDSSELFRAVVE